MNFSDKIWIEKVVSENVDRKSDFFDSIRSVILPKIDKGSFSIAFFDSIRNGLIADGPYRDRSSCGH